MGHGTKKGGKETTMQHIMESMIGEVPGDECVAGKGGHSQSPQTDVYETDSEIIMVVDLPGISKENIDLFILYDRIIVEAIKKEASTPHEARYHCIERLFGKFQRTIEIPTTIHTGKVEAKFKSGVLTIRMLKIEDRRGVKKRIEIK